MRAIVYDQYGSPDMLRLEEVPMPVPKDNEVLVQVFASSINSWDWDLLTGTVQGRIGGFRTPQYAILGADVAGRIVAVGTSVTRHAIGDEVYGDVSGDGWGGFAEFVCVSEKSLAPKPRGASFEQAAAMPQAAVLALQGLRHNGEIQSGQKVLINGAGGGVGTFAVQLAKNAGAEVTGVDKVDKLETVDLVGADHVVDSTKEDFTKSGLLYDTVLDVVATRSAIAHRSTLALGGRYVIVGGTTWVLLQTVTVGSLLSLVGSKKASVLAHRPNHADLVAIGELFESGALSPIIDSSFPLDEIVDGFRRFGSGQHKGKVVINVSFAPI